MAKEAAAETYLVPPMMTDPDGIKDKDICRLLAAEAKRIFENRFGRDGELEQQLTNLENRQFGIQTHQLELKAKIQAKRIYAKRLANFVPLSGAEFRCPKCWLLDEVAARLSEHHVGHYRFSYEFDLHCSRCQETFRI